MCIPRLYLSLGLFNRLWTLLEEACTELGLRLASRRKPWFPVTCGSTFNQYSVLLEKMSSIKLQLESKTSHTRVLEQLAVYISLSVPNPESSEPLKAIRREAGVARQKVDQIVLQYWISNNNQLTYMCLYYWLHLSDQTTWEDPAPEVQSKWWPLLSQPRRQLKRVKCRVTGVLGWHICREQRVQTATGKYIV